MYGVKKALPIAAVAAVAAVVIFGVAFYMSREKPDRQSAGMEATRMDNATKQEAGSTPLPGSEGQAAPRPSDTASLYASLNDSLLKDALFKFPNRLASGIASNGSVSVNTDWENKKPGAKMFIEQQRYGGDLVTAALYTRNKSVLDQGLKVLDWGFARQGAEGNFPDTGDPFHSTELFLEAAARAVLLMQQSGDAGYKELAAGYVPKLKAAAEWMMKPEVARVGQNNNKPYPHRRFADAAALGIVAELTGQSEMAKAAEQYAREGIGLMTPDGVFPEKDGEDPSYQSVGMYYAAKYYFVCKDEALKKQLKDAMQRGMTRVASRIDASGNIGEQGSRTGVETGRSGAVKTFDYKVMVQSLVLVSIITGDKLLYDSAANVARSRKWI